MNRCNECGQGQPVVIDSRGSSKGGPFVEYWECVACGAKGKVVGTGDEPERWEKSGRVFGQEQVI